MVSWCFLSVLTEFAINLSLLVSSQGSPLYSRSFGCEKNERRSVRYQSFAPRFVSSQSPSLTLFWLRKEWKDIVSHLLVHNDVVIILHEFIPNRLLQRWYLRKKEGCWDDPVPIFFTAVTEMDIPLSKHGRCNNTSWINRESAFATMVSPTQRRMLRRSHSQLFHSRDRSGRIDSMLGPHSANATPRLEANLRRFLLLHILLHYCHQIE